MLGGAASGLGMINGRSTESSSIWKISCRNLDKVRN